MKPTTYAIPAALAAVLALLLAFSGCDGSAEGPPPDTNDMSAVKERQMEIMRKERNFQSGNKRSARG